MSVRGRATLPDTHQVAGQSVQQGLVCPAIRPAYAHHSAECPANPVLPDTSSAEAIPCRPFCRTNVILPDTLSGKMVRCPANSVYLQGGVLFMCVFAGHMPRAGHQCPAKRAVSRSAARPTCRSGDVRFIFAFSMIPKTSCVPPRVFGVLGSTHLRFRHCLSESPPIVLYWPGRVARFSCIFCERPETMISDVSGFFTTPSHCKLQGKTMTFQ